MSSETVTMPQPSRSPAPQVDAMAFRHACSRFATGVAIISVLDALGQPRGMTVNSYTSVSLNPLLFLVCIDERAGIRPLLEPGVAIAINILSEDQQALSTRFARTGEDRFGELAWTPGATGAPLIPGVLAVIEGVIRDKMMAGDHAILLTEVQATGYREGRPLVYFASRYQRLGEPLS
jgi:flavin reductase (DIM6/NTAB) family NADH-FMN oxidoreductase RutF